MIAYDDEFDQKVKDYYLYRITQLAAYNDYYKATWTAMNCNKSAEEILELIKPFYYNLNEALAEAAKIKCEFPDRSEYNPATMKI